MCMVVSLKRGPQNGHQHFSFNMGTPRKAPLIWGVPPACSWKSRCKKGGIPARLDDEGGCRAGYRDAGAVGM